MQPLKSKTRKALIFTDLDGTLLNDRYSFKEAQPIICRLQALGARIVCCSSKTRSEIEYYMQQLHISDPFISENGAAIFVPKGYFKQTQGYTKQVKQYLVTELGIPYSDIRHAFERIRANCDCSIEGFGDMTAQKIADACKLPISLARLAKQREYSEPFHIKGEEKRVFEAIRQENLSWTKGGKFYHLIGHHDKASATIILRKMYDREFSDLMVIGVGDGPNDFGMLRVVDKPIMVKGNKLHVTWESVQSLLQ